MALPAGLEPQPIPVWRRVDFHNKTALVVAEDSTEVLPSAVVEVIEIATNVANLVI